MIDFFSAIIGQDKALNLLKKSIATGNINHAYLFSGPGGTGKTAAAMAFAYTLLAEGDENAQIFFRDRIHPDLMVIEKPPNKTLIGKDQITKELEPWVALKPFRANRKIAIIKDSFQMSLEAANALLKTLEEPPHYTVIILISDETNLLETILSRCQMVRFYPVADHIIEQLLISRGIAPDRAGHVARLAQGSIGNALRFVEEVDFEVLRQMVQTMLNNYCQSQYAAVFDTAQKMEADPVLYTNLMEIILRDIYMYQQSKQEGLLAIRDNLDMIKVIPELNPEKIRKALNNINNYKKYYRTNVNSLLINTNIAYEVYEALN